MHLKAVYIFAEERVQTFPVRWAKDWGADKWGERVAAWRGNAQEGDRDPEVGGTDDAGRAYSLLQETEAVWVGGHQGKVWGNQSAKIVAWFQENLNQLQLKQHHPLNQVNPKQNLT